MLESNKDITGHQRNLQILTTEVYKIILKVLYIVRESSGYHEKLIFRENVHNIRNFPIIANENKNSVRHR